MSRYALDPRWITARFNSLCKCGKIIKKHARAFYYPNGRTCLCEECGHAASGEFAAAVADENFYAGGAL